MPWSFLHGIWDNQITEQLHKQRPLLPIIKTATATKLSKQPGPSPPIFQKSYHVNPVLPWQVAKNFQKKAVGYSKRTPPYMIHYLLEAFPRTFSHLSFPSLDHGNILQRSIARNQTGPTKGYMSLRQLPPETIYCQKPNKGSVSLTSSSWLFEIRLCLTAASQTYQRRTLTNILLTVSNRTHLLSKDKSLVDPA